jgi:hypothetical protein
MSEEILFAHPLSYFETRQTPPPHDGDEIVLPRRIWEAWVDLYPAGSPMLVEITPIGIGYSRTVCASQFHVETNSKVYVPNWILQHLHVSCEDEEGVLMMVRPVLEPPPRATLIVLKPLDSALYHTDMRALFEERLYAFHVLQTGTTLSVHVKELGNYEAYACIEHLEPASTVVLGHEVNVEFVQEEEQDEKEKEEGVVATAAATETTAAASVTTETTETAEERMATMRAAWLQRLKNKNF